MSWLRPESTRPQRCVGRRCPALLRGRTSAHRSWGSWETVPGAGSHPVEAQSQTQCDGQSQQRAADSEGRPRETRVHGSASLQTQQDAAHFGWGRCFLISSPLRVDMCRRGDLGAGEGGQPETLRLQPWLSILGARSRTRGLSSRTHPGRHVVPVPPAWAALLAACGSEAEPRGPSSVALCCPGHPGETSSWAGRVTVSH